MKRVRFYKNKNYITFEQESVLGSIIKDTFTVLTLLTLQFVSYTYLGNGILIQIFIALAIVWILSTMTSFEKEVSKDEAIEIIKREWE